ncbi:hypothetical protein FPQ18DRAFT_384432 [Pyronema domesticum]|nr:hypothetical protein FPQ18DRAFT_384432 [Pyronema domesticum]
MAMQAKDNYKLPQLLDQLNNDSEFLGNQTEDCIPMWQQFTGKICSFYETEKTETVTGGTAKRGGPKVPKVMRFSAVVRVRQEESVPINSNHTDMVYFANAEGKFLTVVRNMTEWLAVTKSENEELRCSQKYIDCRKSLKPSDYEGYRDELWRKRHGNYCKWLLHDKRYKAWAEENHQPILWIS